MAHGAGGKATRRLVDGLFAPLLLDGAGAQLSDAAQLEVDGARLAVTTDGFVVTPVSFPGGSIGELAVNGTVNDLAVSGARAVGIVVSFVLEAGLPTEVLEAEVRAMAKAARAAGVPILGGDTKVVEHGKTDRMYITTTGIGRMLPGVTIDPGSVRPGDRILLSGPIGDHGITILLARGELDLEAQLRASINQTLNCRIQPGRISAPGQNTHTFITHSFMCLWWLHFAASLIKTTSLMITPRDATRLPSFIQSNDKIKLSSKFVNCFGAPPSIGCPQILSKPPRWST